MKSIHLPLDKWEKIIESPLQLIKYTLPEETEWKGRTFNKADVIGSEPDTEYKVSDLNTYDYYKNIETNTVVRMLKGTLPENTHMYKKM